MKLHPDTVRELRRYYSRGYSIASLMEAYDLSRSCVNGVVKYRTHRNVTDDDSLPPLVKIERKEVKRRPNEAKPIPPPKPGGADVLLRRMEAQQSYDRTGRWPSWWDPVRNRVKAAPTRVHVCFCGYETSSKEALGSHIEDAHPLKVCPACRAAGREVIGDNETVMAHMRAEHPEHVSSASDS